MNYCEDFSVRCGQVYTEKKLSLFLYLCSMINQDSIVALATPSGAGAIAIIRISGAEAITIGNSVFKSIKNNAGFSSIASLTKFMTFSFCIIL